MTQFVGPELLRSEHSIESFDCGDSNLNWWFANKARHNQTEHSSRIWVVTDGQHVVGFYASSTAAILRSTATRRAARNQPDPLPAVLLGRLTVDVGHQRRGLGAGLLKHFIIKSLEVAQITGVRVLLVHAKDANATAFYRQYGFEPSPIDDLTLMLLVKDFSLHSQTGEHKNVTPCRRTRPALADAVGYGDVQFDDTSVRWTQTTFPAFEFVHHF